jgi:hypothetical protein
MTVVHCIGFGPVTRDLHQHHQIIKPESGPPPQPTHLPIAEPRAHSTGVRRRRNFVSICMCSGHSLVVNTFIPLGVRNGKSLARKRSAAERRCLTVSQ